MRVKVVMSVLTALVLIVSFAAVFVTNFPGSDPQELVDDPVLSDSTPSDGTDSVGPMTTVSEDSGCGEVEEQDDGCDVPPTDDCGGEDECDDCGCPPVDDCGCDDPCDPCDPCEPCDPCDECGCTYTIGYWKNHAGLGNGNQANEVTPLITVAGGAIYLGDVDGSKSIAVNSNTAAKNYLDRQGDSSNGINRLYAQLLGAKLNIINGASYGAVADTIAAADAFLAEHGSADWTELSAEEQNDVNEWKDILDAYNNGEIGPGHCD